MSDYNMWTGIWLEVTKARREGNIVSVQVKGDREDREPVWWPIQSTITASLETHAADLLRQLFDGLDKNRLVTVRLVPAGPKNGETPSYLTCVDIRIQSADSSLR